MHHMLRSSMAMEIMKIVTLRNWWILQPRFADLSIYEEEYTTQWSTQFKSQSICQLLSNPFKHSNSKVLQLAKCSWIASCKLWPPLSQTLCTIPAGSRTTRAGVSLLGPISCRASPQRHTAQLQQHFGSGINKSEIKLKNKRQLCHKDVKCLYNGFYIGEIVNSKEKVLVRVCSLEVQILAFCIFLNSFCFIFYPTNCFIDLKEFT